jgi:cytochrome c oxidase cbb3-type subunit III
MAGLRCKRGLSIFAVCLLTAALCTSLAQQGPESTPSNHARKGSLATGDGRQSFDSHCASCHGLDGRGGEHAHAIATPRAAGALEDIAVFQIIRGGIPAKGMPSFNSLSEPQTYAIVAYLRLLTGKNTVRPQQGYPPRGERLFFAKAHCGDCHMMQGKGGFMGSDLTDFAATHTVEELRRAIIHPEQWIAPEQNLVTVTTLSRDRVTGLVRDEDNFSMQVQDADGVFHLLQKSQIVKVDRKANSLMPGDYGTRLTSAELDDLISFLFSNLPASTHGSTGTGRTTPEAAPKQPPEPDSK